MKPDNIKNSGKAASYVQGTNIDADNDVLMTSPLAGELASAGRERSFPIRGQTTLPLRGKGLKLYKIQSRCRKVHKLNEIVTPKYCSRR